MTTATTEEIRIGPIAVRFLVDGEVLRKDELFESFRYRFEVPASDAPAQIPLLVERYLRPGDHLHAANEVESISPKKTTGLGQGYFVTWVTTYRTAEGEVVGRQLFRVFKFDPRTIGAPR